MSFLKIENISKSFDGRATLRDISLEIWEGDFFSLLGPSGCGKTTLLRIIAGLEMPTSGRILLDGKDITNLPPQKRNIGFVFQNYALFPSMTVAENVAYGLQLRKVDKATINDKVADVLGKMKITHKKDQKVGQLSGGEQQRVSLARVIVTEPQLILLDEPLSNLDYSLRLEARTELKRLQQELGITSVFVTHDQSEALAMSDGLAVLNKGYVSQAGTPATIYHNPRNEFVADFVGHYNLFSPAELSAYFGVSEEGGATYAVLPEHVVLSPNAAAPFTITNILFNGAFTEYFLQHGDRQIRVLAFGGSGASPARGSRVHIAVLPANIKKLEP